MSGLINLIILYLVFSAISSFVKKAQQQQAALKKSGKVSGPQPKKSSGFSLEDIFAVPQQSKEPPPMEDILDLEDDEIAFHAEEIPEESPVEPPPLPIKPAPQAKARRAPSLLSFNEKSYTQGIILSEILGPPASRRQTRRGL